MKIKANKDFLTEYKDDFWKGFSFKELIYFGIAGVVAFGIILGLFFGFGVNPATAVYIAIPAVAPIIFFEFYKYQGYLPVRQLCKELIFGWHTRKLSYHCMEQENERKKVFCMYKKERSEKKWHL